MVLQFLAMANNVALKTLITRCVLLLVNAANCLNSTHTFEAIFVNVIKIPSPWGISILPPSLWQFWTFDCWNSDINYSNMLLIYTSSILAVSCMINQWSFTEQWWWEFDLKSSFPTVYSIGLLCHALHQSISHIIGSLKNGHSRLLQ